MEWAVTHIKPKFAIEVRLVKKTVFKHNVGKLCALGTTKHTDGVLYSNNIGIAFNGNAVGFLELFTAIAAGIAGEIGNVLQTQVSPSVTELKLRIFNKVRRVCRIR